MKINTSAVLIGIDGKALEIKAGEPLTLGDALRFAVAADPVWEAGQNQGAPRPLSASEVADRIALVSKLKGEEAEITAAEAAKAQAMVRTAFRAAFAVPITAMLDGE